MYIHPHGSKLPGEETVRTALIEPKRTLALVKEPRLDDGAYEG
jgi:hypothetical protein